MTGSSQSTTQLYYGPEDPSVLFLQKDHISRRLWAGENRKPLTVRRYEGKLWDCKPIHQRVVEYIDRLGFSAILACGKPKELDHHLITALVERWRPETHTFHLPTGETTVTLQDVEVFWGLRVDGYAVTGVDLNLKSEDWMELCHRLLGFTPRDTEMKKSGISVTALIARMSVPLADDLNDEVYLQRARMYVLVLLGGLVLPDGTGCKIPLIYLTLLEDVDMASQLSWGSAALATLYHNLCQASCDHKKDIGGPLVLLQLWALERMPNLRPEFQHCTEKYREQLAHLQPNQFIWEPFSERVLPDVCTAGQGCWRATTFMICWHIVEPHEPHRVMRQFGLSQHIPKLEDKLYADTHMNISRRGKAGKDWATHNRLFIHKWNMRHQMVQDAVDDLSGFMTHEYMRWYRSITVTYITQPDIHSQQRFRESASSLAYALESLSYIYHVANEDESPSPTVRRVLQIAEDALKTCGEGFRIDQSHFQRTQVDTSMPIRKESQRVGNRGVQNVDAGEGEGDRTHRPLKRRSGTGCGTETIQEGSGRGNWRMQTDELAQVKEEVVNEDEKNLNVEKPSGEEDAAKNVEKEAIKEENEEKPENKEMTLEEYEKFLEEKRKTLLAFKSKKVKVEGKEFESMQAPSNKKANALGSEKDKKKELAEKEER